MPRIDHRATLFATRVACTRNGKRKSMKNRDLTRGSVCGKVRKERENDLCESQVELSIVRQRCLEEHVERREEERDERTTRREDRWKHTRACWLEKGKMRNVASSLRDTQTCRPGDCAKANSHLPLIVPCSHYATAEKAAAVVPLSYASLRRY